jgi:thioesterase domain-containing protein
MQSCAEQCLAAGKELLGDRPFVLLGHSWGALLALEAVRQLEDSGKDVPMVVLLDPSPEMFSPQEEEDTDEAALADLLRFALRLGTSDLGDALRGPLSRGDAAETLKAASAIFDKSTMRTAFAVARARSHNLRLRPTDWPKPTRKLRSRVFLVLAIEGEAELQIQKRKSLESCFDLLAEDVTIVWSAGDHYSMLSSSYSAGLAKTLTLATSFNNGSLLG